MRSALLLAVLLPWAAFAQKTEDEAGDTSEVDKDSSGPLRDRVRPVSGHLFLMKGRFEASPGLGISIKDAFFSKWTPKLALTFHFTEDFAVSLRGGYSISIVSNAAQICPGTGTACVPPTFELLSTKDAFGQNSLNAGLEVQWSPIYGKIGLVAEKFLSFNLYVAAGPAIVMYGRANKLGIGADVGIGLRFFINKFLTVRTEFRDLIYAESFGPDKNQNSFRNQLMGEVGFSIFLPTTFEPR